MKWFGRRESSNVDDRRGFSTGGFAAGGGIIGFIIYLLINVFGGDANQVSQWEGPPQRNEQGVGASSDAEEDTMARFASVILAGTEDVWSKLFSDKGGNYNAPTLVLFNGSTQSSCGMANSATGPFYCSRDQKVYLDLSFFNELKDRFGASGDFANAYVIAHEVGHHVQYLMGTTEKISHLQQNSSERDANRLSVALELQADFYAGVWAHYDEQMQHSMDAGDLQEALNAANAIGDDRLQKMSTGQVMPDAFTHGTSAQRMYWFKKGFDTGDLSQGNTFKELLN